jgi:hypothetical protein
MGSTVVFVGEHQIRIHDPELELWLRLLALHIDPTSEPDSPAAGIRRQWLVACCGAFNGVVPDCLDEFAAEPEAKEIVRAAVQSLLRSLEMTRGRLSAEFVNLLNLNGRWRAERELNREYYLQLGRAFLDLIDGKPATTPTAPSFLPSGES